MRIVFVIATLDEYGGTVRVATLLANGLAKKYDITILSKKSGKNAYPLDAKISDIKLDRNDFKFISQCKRYIKDNVPDYLIIHTMSKLSVALLLAGVQAKNIWSLEHISFKFHSPLFKALRYILYRKLDKIITLTKEDAFNYRFRNNVVVIPNISPLEISLNTYNSQLRRVVSIGRLTYQKGYDMLIKAWSEIALDYPNWTLDIYGEGEDEHQLRKMIDKYGLECVYLKGVTDTVQNVYDKASIYVMSSRFEGFGMVLIEAQSRGLPIVSFNCPSGPNEIINHGIDGYLVENGNITELAGRIKELIQNQHLRNEFSKNALISAERFKLETIIQQWINLIEGSHV